MKLNKKKPKIYAATVSLAVAAGVTAGVSSYREGTAFQPSASSREIRENRVSFSDEGSLKNRSQTEGQDKSALWEKDESAQEKSALEQAQNAAYLFEQIQQQLNDGQNTMNITPNQEEQLPDPAAGQRPSGNNENTPVYDITDKKENADTVIKNNPNGTSDNTGNGQNSSGTGQETPKPSGDDSTGDNDGDATGNGGTSGDDSSSGTGDNNQSSSGTDKSDSDNGNGNNGKDDNNKSDDNSNQQPKPSSPASTAKDPEVTQKPRPNTDIISDRQDSYQEDKVTNETVKKRVVIRAGSNEECILYKGQSVDATKLYYALDTYVLDYSTPGSFVAYLWGEEDYGRYIQISGVSFDGEQTWTDAFPVTIPEDVEDGSMYIKVQYRLTQKDDWEEVSVSYDPKATRLFLLSQKLQNENEEINSSWILNWDQYPEPGSTLDLYNSIGTYFGWSGDTLPGLLLGWMEDGEIVPWKYLVTAGRHILEPVDLIPLDPMFEVTLKYQWFGEDGRVDPDGYNLYYLQTLTGLNVDRVTEDGAKYLAELEIPKYTQAVCLKESVETDTIRIPDTVLYIQNDGNGLRVNKSYEVDEQNSNYASENGMLLDKGKTEILGIPYEKKEITISSDITKVNLTADNQIEIMRIEAEDLSEIPDMDLSNLSGCKVIVPDELLDAFLEQYGEVLTASENCVAASSDPDRTYVYHNGIVTDDQQELYKVFGYSGTSLRIPSYITAIGSKAFQSAENIHTLVWPEQAQITLKADSFADSGVTKIICRSQEQLDALAAQLDELEIKDITLYVSGKSDEGYSYYAETSEDSDGELSTVLTVTEAPADVTEFNGIIYVDKEALVVNQIEANAFSGCTQLKWVILPEDTSYIGYQAFRGCSALEGVLIDTKEQVTIGDQAFEECSSLRFVASNAKQAQMQGDYEPTVTNQESYDGFTRISYFFAPQDGEGYGYSANTLPEMENVDHYEVCETGTEGRVLYGVDTNGIKWLALRSGQTLDSQTELPVTTSRIYSYAFSGSIGENFQMNWSGLPLTQIQEGAFYMSGVAGDIVLGTEEENSALILEDYAFAACRQMTSVTIPANLTYLGQMVFVGGSSLKSTRIDRALYSVSFYSDLFRECDQMETLTLGMETPMQLVIYGTMRYQFNSDWTPEEEKEHLRLIVPEGAEQNYIMNWRYAFSGSVGAYSGCFYLDLWNSVQGDLIDWDTMYFPADEEVDVAAKSRLLEAENRIRDMVGTGEVSEPTELYQFRLVGNNLTLVGVPSYRSEISLDPVTVDLPEGWFLDDIGSGALAGTKNLSRVTIPADMVTIWSGALEGAASDSSQVTLEFQGESPLTLSGYTPDNPFAFGIDESKIQIQVPEGTQTDYIRAWTWPLTGYQDAEELEAAVRENLAENGSEPVEKTDDTESDDQEQQVQEEMVKILLPAENRLRRMMGMEEAKDGSDLISYDFVELVQETETEEAGETEEAEPEEALQETEQEQSEAEESEDEAGKDMTGSDADSSPEDESEKEPETSETEEETTAESEASSETEAGSDSQEDIKKNTETTEAAAETEKVKTEKEETAEQNAADAEIRQETVFRLVLAGSQKESKK